MNEKQEINPEKPAYFSRILTTFEIIHIIIVEVAVISLLMVHAIQLNQDEWQKAFHPHAANSTTGP